jgi:hypothetical protein
VVLKKQSYAWLLDIQAFSGTFDKRQIHSFGQGFLFKTKLTTFAGSKHIFPVVCEPLSPWNPDNNSGTSPKTKTKIMTN